MQGLEVSGAVRLIYGSLGVKRLSVHMSFIIKNKLYMSAFKFAKLPMHSARGTQQSTGLTSSGQIPNCQLLGRVF